MPDDCSTYKESNSCKWAGFYRCDWSCSISEWECNCYEIPQWKRILLFIGLSIVGVILLGWALKSARKRCLLRRGFEGRDDAVVDLSLFLSLPADSVTSVNEASSVTTSQTATVAAATDYEQEELIRLSPEFCIQFGIEPMSARRNLQ